MLNPQNQKEIELSENQFKNEQNGLVYENVTLALPKAVIDYYRMKAHFNNTIELETDFIAADLIEKLNADIDGMTPECFKETLNLTETLQKLAQP